MASSLSGAPDLLSVRPSSSTTTRGTAGGSEIDPHIASSSSSSLSRLSGMDRSSMKNEDAISTRGGRFAAHESADWKPSTSFPESSSAPLEDDDDAFIRTSKDRVKLTTTARHDELMALDSLFDDAPPLQKGPGLRTRDKTTKTKKKKKPKKETGHSTGAEMRTSVTSKSASPTAYRAEDYAEQQQQQQSQSGPSGRRELLFSAEDATMMNSMDVPDGAPVVAADDEKEQKDAALLRYFQDDDDDDKKEGVVRDGNYRGRGVADGPDRLDVLLDVFGTSVTSGAGKPKLGRRAGRGGGQGAAAHVSISRSGTDKVSVDAKGGSSDPIGDGTSSRVDHHVAAQENDQGGQQHPRPSASSPDQEDRAEATRISSTAGPFSASPVASPPTESDNATSASHQPRTADVPTSIVHSGTTPVDPVVVTSFEQQQTLEQGQPQSPIQERKAAFNSFAADMLDILGDDEDDLSSSSMLEPPESPSPALRAAEAVEVKGEHAEMYAEQTAMVEKEGKSVLVRGVAAAVADGSEFARGDGNAASAHRLGAVRDSAPRKTDAAGEPADDFVDEDEDRSFGRPLSASEVLAMCEDSPDTSLDDTLRFDERQSTRAGQRANVDSAHRFGDSSPRRPPESMKMMHQQEKVQDGDGISFDATSPSNAVNTGTAIEGRDASNRGYGGSAVSGTSMVVPKDVEGVNRHSERTRPARMLPGPLVIEPSATTRYVQDIEKVNGDERTMMRGGRAPHVARSTAMAAQAATGGNADADADAGTTKRASEPRTRNGDSPTAAPAARSASARTTIGPVASPARLQASRTSHGTGQRGARVDAEPSGAMSSTQLLTMMEQLQRIEASISAQHDVVRVRGAPGKDQESVQRSEAAEVAEAEAQREAEQRRRKQAEEEEMRRRQEWEEATRSAMEREIETRTEALDARCKALDELRSTQRAEMDRIESDRRTLDERERILHAKEEDLKRRVQNARDFIETERLLLARERGDLLSMRKDIARERDSLRDERLRRKCDGPSDADGHRMSMEQFAGPGPRLVGPTYPDRQLGTRLSDLGARKGGCAFIKLATGRAQESRDSSAAAAALMSAIGGPDWDRDRRSTRSAMDRQKEFLIQARAIVASAGCTGSSCRTPVIPAFTMKGDTSALRAVRARMSASPPPPSSYVVAGGTPQSALPVGEVHVESSGFLTVSSPSFSDGSPGGENGTPTQAQMYDTEN